MKKFLNKKIKYIITGLILIIMINIAISFAYIRGTTLNNESLSTVALTGGRVYVKYNGNTSDIIVNDILPGFETTKQFTVTSEFGNNHEYYKDGVWYTIALVIDKNEFDDGSIICSIKSDESSDNDGILAKSSNISMPSGENQSGINIASGRFDNNNMSHVYNLKIRYPETGVNQSHMVNAEFQAHVILTNPQLINLIFDLDDGSFTNLNLNSNSSIKVPANSTINLPTPIKDGYAFSGWEIVSGNVSISNTLISTGSNDITLKALWSKGFFDYTGGEQEFIANLSGYYKLEAWGAQGGASSDHDPGGKGGYTSGVIKLIKNEILYVYVGEYGYEPNGHSQNNPINAFNGGGAGDATGSWSESYSGIFAGGGATDFRLVDGTWSDSLSLKSRIIVAGGGGGGNSGDGGGPGGAGGGLIGGNSVDGKGGIGGIGGNQVVGYQFGVGQSSGVYPNDAGADTGAGGGGYYGGYRGSSTNCGGGGGSSYISGHTGCVAIESASSTSARTGTGGASCTTGTSDNLCSVHYSGKVFTDTVMIDGTGYAWTNTKGALQPMPNPSGGYYASGVGHSGNGYARITYLHS